MLFSPAAKKVGFVLIPLILLIATAPSESATRQDLRNEVDKLSALIELDISQDIEVVNAIIVAVAPPLSLTVGTIEGTRGTSVYLPVYFKSGASPVSSLQFDIAGSSEVVISSVTAGIAAQAAGKSVQGTKIDAKFRTLVFGLNATALSSGPVAILKVAVPANATAGNKSILISAISASSPAGTNVVLTGKNCSLTVK